MVWWSFGSLCLRHFRWHVPLDLRSILRYGVADLATLAGDTHKFESRYLEPWQWNYRGHGLVYEWWGYLVYLTRTGAGFVSWNGQSQIVRPVQLVKEYQPSMFVHGLSHGFTQISLKHGESRVWPALGRPGRSLSGAEGPILAWRRLGGFQFVHSLGDWISPFKMMSSGEFPSKLMNLSCRVPKNPIHLIKCQMFIISSTQIYAVKIDP